MAKSLFETREGMLLKAPSYAFECEICDRESYIDYLREKSTRAIYSGSIKYETLVNGWDFVALASASLMVGQETKRGLMCCVWVGRNDRPQSALDRLRSWVEISLPGLEGPQMLLFPEVALDKVRPGVRS